MARPKFGQLYQLKNSPNWVFQKKGFPGRIDTGTSDRFRAEQFMRAASAKVGDPHPSPEENAVANGLESLARSLYPGGVPTDIPANEKPTITPETGPPGLPVSAPLWEAKPLPNSAPTMPGAPVNKAIQTIDAFKSRFTPAKRERLFGAMGAGLARVDAIIYELGLGIGGYKLKEAYVFSPEDIEIMKTAYEMGLDEVFNNADPQWYHLLLIGNASMIVSSLPYIEKKPKKIEVIVAEGSDAT